MADPLKLGPKGAALIKKWEGYDTDLGDGRVKAYLCPAGVWTIGWGSTGPDICQGTIWTREQAQARFEMHAEAFAADVRRLIGRTATTQDQFDALVSFTYNLGAANLQQSTLLRKHKNGDHAGAALEFRRWNRAAGRVLNGLTKRRAEEAALYRGQE